MFGKKQNDKMFEQIFQLKFSSKQLTKEAKKCESEEKQLRLKVKSAIEKNNVEGAQIYAQNAIRKRQESLNYLKLGSRLDFVCSTLQTQARMHTISNQMGGIVKNLDVAIKSNNLNKLAETMDSFEKQCEDLNIRTETMDQTMGNQMGLTTPQEEVDSLMHQVADEHGLTVKQDLPGAQNKIPQQEQPQSEFEDDLARRLADLKR